MESLKADETHPRVIIHIDMDYYYAQVEEVLDPTLKDKPFAVKQRFCVVTANYIAREYGVRKLQPVKEALGVCPELTLINGEDITKYKEMSVRINEIMHKFTSKVEKLGLDENFLDVTEVVDERLEQIVTGGKLAELEKLERVAGFIHPPKEVEEEEEAQGTSASDLETFRRCCCCGCDRKLILATHLAQEVRDCIFSELGLRCCAGISHNKLLAKLVGNVNKQNKQTVLLPSCGGSFVASLGQVRHLTGIGEKTAHVLEECGIKTVTDLQEYSLEQLTKRLGAEQATRLKQLAYGRDDTPVKTTGKPKSVGLEDSCPSISVRADVEEKFRHLLVRLVKNIAEDGRIPIAIKVTIRKYDSQKRTSHRECKQDKLLPSMFRHADSKLLLADGAQEKILAIVMKVFERMVDLRQPFNITLLGLSFFKFQERKIGSKSIANFLIKKSDIEVQSITNLSNESITLSDSFYSNKSSTAMDYEACCSSDAGSLASLSGSESDIEPSPKKSRRLMFLGHKKNNFLLGNEDESSPSKLRVADLRLNSKEYDQESSPSPMDVSGPTGSGKLAFLKDSPMSSPPVMMVRPHAVSPSNPATVASSSNCSSTPTIVSSKSTNLPPNVDPEVFNALPLDVQQELLANWRRTTSASGSSSSSSGTSSGNSNNASSSGNTGGTVGNAATGKGSAKNTLHRYFVKNT